MLENAFLQLRKLLLLATKGDDVHLRRRFAPIQLIRRAKGGHLLKGDDAVHRVSVQHPGCLLPAFLPRAA
ncbi:hypothetical protein D1872_313510 [compost metagenome]